MALYAVLSVYLCILSQDLLKKLRKGRSVEQETRFKDLQKEMLRIRGLERFRNKYKNSTAEDKENKKRAKQITRENYSTEKAADVKRKNTAARKDARSKVTLPTPSSPLYDLPHTQVPSSPGPVSPPVTAVGGSIRPPGAGLESSHSPLATLQILGKERGSQVIPPSPLTCMTPLSPRSPLEPRLLTTPEALSVRQGAVRRTAPRPQPPSRAWTVPSASLGQATPSCLGTP